MSKVFSNSSQSVELSASFETANTNMVTDVKRLSMMTTRALADFSGLGMEFSFNFNPIPSVGFGDNTINWNFAGFAFIPLFQTNQQRFAVIE